MSELGNKVTTRTPITYRCRWTDRQTDRPKQCEHGGMVGHCPLHLITNGCQVRVYGGGALVSWEEEEQRELFSVLNEYPPAFSESRSGGYCKRKE